MKFILPFLTLLFSGCLYFNEQGVSTHLYDNCQEYYDNCGNYHKECPENLVDYKELQEGTQEVVQEMKAYILNPPKECHEPESSAQ